MTATGRKPLSRIRSEWQDEGVGVGGFPWHSRRVGDGTLRAIAVEEPLGWHMSISFVNHRGDPTRYPRWDEIADARDHLLPADAEFVMWLPKASEYVAVHDTTFHLHEHPPRPEENR